MSILRPEVNDINELIEQMNDYFLVTPARTEDINRNATEYTFPIIAQHFDEVLCRKSSINYLTAHPEKANSIREINSQIIDVSVNTLTDYINIQFTKIKFDNVEKSIDDLIAIQAAQVDYFTNIIIATVDKSQRDLMVERLIFTADKLIEKGNYFTANAIYLSLMTPQVKEIYLHEGKWVQLSKEALAKMSVLEDHFSPKNKEYLVEKILERNNENQEKSVTSGILPPLPLVLKLLRGDKITADHQLTEVPISVQKQLKSIYCLYHPNEINNDMNSNALANEIFENIKSRSLQQVSASKEQDDLRSKISTALFKHYLSLKGTKTRKSRLLRSGLNLTVPIEYQTKMSTTMIIKADVNLLRSQISKLGERIKMKLGKKNKLQSVTNRIQKYMNDLSKRGTKDLISAIRHKALSVVMNKLSKMSNLNKINYLDHLIKRRGKVDKNEIRQIGLLKAYSHDLAESMAEDLKNPKMDISTLNENHIKENLHVEKSALLNGSIIKKNNVTFSTKEVGAVDEVPHLIESHINKLNEMIVFSNAGVEMTSMLDELEKACQALLVAKSMDDIIVLMENMQDIHKKYYSDQGKYAGFFDEKEKADIKAQIEAVDDLIEQKEKQIQNSLISDQKKEEVTTIKDSPIPENTHSQPTLTMKLENLDHKINDYIIELSNRNRDLYKQQAEAGDAAMKNMVDNLINIYQNLFNAHNRYEIDKLHVALNKAIKDYQDAVSRESLKNDEIIVKHHELMNEIISSKMDLLTPYDVKMNLEAIDKAITEDIKVLENQMKNNSNFFTLNDIEAMAKLLDLYDELLNANSMDDTRILHNKVDELKREEGLNHLIHGYMDHMKRVINHKVEQFKPPTYHPLKDNEHEENHVSLKRNRFFLSGIGRQIKKAGSEMINLGNKGIEKGVESIKNISTKFKKD